MRDHTDTTEDFLQAVSARFAQAVVDDDQEGAGWWVAVATALWQADRRRDGLS